MNPFLAVFTVLPREIDPVPLATLPGQTQFFLFPITLGKSAHINKFDAIL